MNILREHPSIVKEIIRKKGVISVQGDRGVGKTRFCKELLISASQNKIKAAYIDAEIARGIIEAPGTVSLAIIDTEITTLRDLKRKDWSFIGALNPIGHGINLIYSIQKMVNRAKSEGCEIIVIDSCGFIDYKDVVIFKQNELEILNPDFIVAIQRSHEIEFLICPFLRRSNVICCLLEAKDVSSYSKEIEEANLKADFATKFRGMETHIMPISQASFTNTWLYNGRELKWQYKNAVSKILGSEVFHAEVACKTLFIFSRANIDEKKKIQISEILKIDQIVIQSPDIFHNLYVGLEDELGNLLGLGIIENMLFDKKQIVIKSNILTVSPVKNIKFGFISLPGV